MSTALTVSRGTRPNYQANPATRETRAVRWLLLALGLGFFGLFLLLPLVAVFTEALRKGWEVYFASLADDARAGRSTSRRWPTRRRCRP